MVTIVPLLLLGRSTKSNLLHSVFHFSMCLCELPINLCLNQLDLYLSTSFICLLWSERPYPDLSLYLHLYYIRYLGDVEVLLNIWCCQFLKQCHGRHIILLLMY